MMTIYTRKVKTEYVADAILKWCDGRLIPASWCIEKRWYVVTFQLAPTDTATYKELKKYVLSLN